MVHLIPTVSNIMLHINLISSLINRQRLSESVKCVCVCVCVCSVVSGSATPWTVTCQAPLSMKFSDQE